MQHYLHIGNARDVTDAHDRFTYRSLEILPGILAWGTLALVVIFSFVQPVWMAFFIIAFDVYWLVKTIYLSLHMRSSFQQMRKNLRHPWMQDLQTLAPATGELAGSTYHAMYHLVILPMYQEPLTIVRESIASLARCSYPKEKMIIVLATEERAHQHARYVADEMTREFGSTFFKFITTEHPANLPGEIPGKGSNETWAARQVQRELIDRFGIPYEHVIVSVFDVDTNVHPDFFACLAWHYLTADRPLHSSFQPIPLFTNNIWEAPAFARLFAFSTTFWQMIQQARPERLVTFSSQSMSFSALVDVGFWQVNVVSEDSRIYWQCLLRYSGDWRTVPLYFPVSMDANVAPTFWQTIQNQYKQIRRWHFGVENNPYFIFGFLKDNQIPLLKKLHTAFFMVETSHSAATNSFIIFLLGWLPLFAGGIGFSQNILSYNLPQITRFIMSLSMFGLITTAAISMVLLPPRPPKYGKFSWVWMALQWVLLPLNLVVFGAIPALDAQTRLLFGKYLGFWVTPKTRGTTQSEKVSETQLSVAPTEDATVKEGPVPG